MYTFSSKLKTFSFILMVLGALGIGYGFLTAPKNIEEVEAILKAQEASHHGGGHAEGHEAEAGGHEAHMVPEIKATEENHAVVSEDAAAETAEVKLPDTISVVPVVQDSIKEATAPVVAEEPAPQHRVAAVDEHAEHQKHLEHVLHQLQNKPWAALYVACIFLMLISLGVLAFYAIQIVSQAGWSPLLFRVMQGITAYLPVGSVIFFILLVIAGFHIFESNHLFAWMAEGITDPKSPHYDKMIAGKSGYLNVPAWLIRAAVFLIGWNLYRYFSRKNCLALDEASDNAYHKKNFKISAGFLVFFIVTESIMSWDWIMSIEPHWFSTLFGWYVFGSFIVSAITVICVVTIYLKSRGFLPQVNTSHIHDLAKYMFGFSIFWTYLWFAQFMLIWYADIPEEITYFVTRIQVYNLPFFGALVLNFVFPILILMNTDFKRLTWILAMASLFILVGHYLDFFNMIMPGTVGKEWFIGIPELSSLSFFIGLFIFVVFTALTKAPLAPKRNPFIEESKHFHY